ncbi:hypothetical protein HYX19_02560 [Candidatus Woesearchaeota archaeon]|nr:hypothetical protein [Candidatus Woesearchaeota archaeon]
MNRTVKSIGIGSLLFLGGLYVGSYLQQNIKNGIGDLLGYGRSPLTKDTFRCTDLVSIFYNNVSGILFSRRTLEEFTPEQIAEATLQTSWNNQERRESYNLERIAQDIREGKFYKIKRSGCILGR